MGLSTGPKRKTLSEINVTPLVDVMLVLLVIFMITAPMLQQGVELDLPEVEAADEQLLVSINGAGAIFVDGTRLPDDRWIKALAAIVENRKQEPVFVEADEAVPYGRVARLLGVLRQAGATKLNLVTKEPDRR